MAEAERAKALAVWRLDNRLDQPGWTLLRERLRCLCEGGARCIREDPAAQAGGNAVDGLHSSWIPVSLAGDDERPRHLILACARPIQANVEENDTARKMRDDHGVRAVFNLQEVGEHAHCGRGILEESGFSYLPSHMMEHGISYYNFGYADMSVATFATTLNVVKVMAFHAIARGEGVAVHCHSGLGRTGVMICCFLIYALAMAPGDAVAHVRAHRPGSVQTRRQEDSVHAFAAALSDTHVDFPLPFLRGRAEVAGDAASVARVAELEARAARRRIVRADEAKAGANDVWDAATFESLLASQAECLHGASFRRHPAVLHAAASRLASLSDGSNPNAAEAIAKAACAAGALGGGRSPPAVDGAMVRRQLACHCGQWESLGDMSSEECVWLVDEWFASLPPHPFENDGIAFDVPSQAIVVEPTSVRAHSLCTLRKFLLGHFTRQKALVLHAAVYVSIAAAGDGGGREEGAALVVRWLAQRLAGDAKGKAMQVLLERLSAPVTRIHLEQWLGSVA